MARWRRFEVMLPLQPDGGSSMVWRLVDAAMKEIPEGRWWQEHRQLDHPIRLVFEIPDQVRYRACMKGLKHSCKETADGRELSMVSYCIEVE